MLGKRKRIHSWTTIGPGHKRLGLDVGFELLRGKYIEPKKPISPQEESTGKENLFYEWCQFLTWIGEKMGGWDWFSTWTFRQDTHPESAMKAFRLAQHQMNRKIYGVRYTDRDAGISSLVAIEFQKRGVIHLHSLDAGTRNYPRCVSKGNKESAMDIWFRMAGIARVRAYHNNKIKGVERGAIGYVAKYLLKGRKFEWKGAGELHLVGPFSQLRSPLHGRGASPRFIGSNAAKAKQSFHFSGRGGN